VDLRQVVFLKLREYLIEFVWVSEEKLVNVVVIGNINQTQRHQLLKPEFPLDVGDILVDGPPLSVRALCLYFFVGRALLMQERELHLDIVMDVVIILKHDVVV